MMLDSSLVWYDLCSYVVLAGLERHSTGSRGGPDTLVLAEPHPGSWSVASPAVLWAGASILSEPFQGLTSLGACSRVGGILVRLRTGFAIAIAIHNMMIMIGII